TEGDLDRAGRRVREGTGRRLRRRHGVEGQGSAVRGRDGQALQLGRREGVTAIVVGAQDVAKGILQSRRGGGVAGREGLWNLATVRRQTGTDGQGDGLADGTVNIVEGQDWSRATCLAGIELPDVGDRRRTGTRTGVAGMIHVLDGAQHVEVIDVLVVPATTN